ncbi:hypothetical protein K1719_010178 [Acacia pycnantha]|nr:hypothetical protein K1719_010178 [Acacia pycnantha]
MASNDDDNHHLPHSTTPPATTIESLPNHVLSEVLAKVGSSSMGKLYELKSCSKNFNNLIEEDDYIYKNINMHKFASFHGTQSPKNLPSWPVAENAETQKACTGMEWPNSSASTLI